MVNEMGIEMKKSDNLIYTLSRNMVIFLFVYYFVIMFGGMYFTIRIICNLTVISTEVHFIKSAFIISIAVCGMLCSVQYIKRLYKACITNRIEYESGSIKCIGNIMYFISRPIFAFVFAVIMVCSLLSGLFIVTGALDYILNEKFIYLCVIISSYLGYSIGSLIDRFEKYSETKIKDYKKSV